MDIYFCTLDRKKIYQLPVLPEEMPELEASMNNEEFETYNNGFFNVLGNSELVSFTLESFIQGKDNNYYFAKKHYDNPYDLINLWRKSMINKAPIRCIMYRNNKTEILNWMVSVESMKWHEDKAGDIKYSVTFKEYRKVTA